MVNLILLTSTSFEMSSGSSSIILPRAYETRLNRAGRIIIRHVITGAVIELGVLSDIRINSLPATFEAIRRTVFNLSCICIDDGGIPSFKIFDFTFDNTFE